MTSLTRRGFMIAAPMALAACTTTNQHGRPLKPMAVSHPVPADVQARYGAVLNEPYQIPAADMSKIDPQYWRQIVPFNSSYPVGTLIVDTQNRFLYLVQPNGQALRYGIGVGKAGLALEGEAVVQYKRQWPRWTPTPDMMARDPERYGHLGDGMGPGLDNPLGARALYLFRNGQDTLYRIHGSHETWSIGRAVSSGCVRLLNQDIIDLYGRVADGSRVVVLQHGQDGGLI